MQVKLNQQNSLNIDTLNFVRLFPICVGFTPLIWRVIDGKISTVFFVTWICLISTIICALPVLIGSQVYSPNSFHLSFVFTHGFLVFFLAALPTVSEENYRAHPNETTVFVLSSCMVWLGITWGSALLQRLIIPQNKVFITRRRSNDLSLIAVLVVMGFISIFSALIIMSGSKIPLFQVIQGENYSVILQSRQEILRAHAGEFSAYFFIFVRNYLLPFCLGASLIRFTSVKNRVNLFLVLYLFSIGLFLSLLTIEKSPIARLIITPLLSVMIFRVRISMTRILIMLSTTVLGLLALVKVTNGASSLTNLSAALFHRLFVDPAWTAEKYFEWAPKYSGGFMLGRNLTYLNRFLSSGPIDATRLVYDYIYPLAPVKGNADAAFHAALWIDFSWFGILLAVLGTSLILVVLDRSIATISDVGFRSSARALFMLQTLFLVSSSWGSSILSGGLGALDIILFCLVLSLFNVSKLYKKSLRKLEL